jgi:hypothetical protein
MMVHVNTAWGGLGWAYRVMAWANDFGAELLAVASARAPGDMKRISRLCCNAAAPGWRSNPGTIVRLRRERSNHPLSTVVGMQGGLGLPAMARIAYFCC